MSWIPKDGDSKLAERKMLLRRAKAGDAEAIAALRKLGLLTWDRADVGVIV